MNASRAHPERENGDGSRFHMVQPERDLVANWEVDLSNKLEEYLLKVCSGEIPGNEDDAHIPVNFAEAALLLQGSIQVYSKKVEYLYNLVLHALEFLSQQRRQDQKEDGLTQPEESCSGQDLEEEDDLFWNADVIQTDPKNNLEISNQKDDFLNHFVKPPPNLVVLEGDSLDCGGDGGELEAFLLATAHLYREFILLDPSDAPVVDGFVENLDPDKEKRSASKRGSARRSFCSPGGRSAGTARKSSAGKKQDKPHNLFPEDGCGFELNNRETGFHSTFDNPGDCQYEFNMDEGPEVPECSDGYDSENNDDPWKPLNPHEPGTLKVKPFRKVKAFRHKAVKFKKSTLCTLFPLARVGGAPSPESTERWKNQRKGSEKATEARDIPFFEQLRQSLLGVNETCDGYGYTGNEDDVDEDNGMPEFGHLDGGFLGSMCMDEDVLHQNENSNNKKTVEFQGDEGSEGGEPCSQASLEDLCRSHLDALLASIAETEKQTELAARVSSWKQKIEQNLEEQDSRSPFDIHVYGDRILDKLSLEAEAGSVIPFSNVVMGQKKHEVARAFSALLQLANNGDVDLEKGGRKGELFCHSAARPFGVRLLKNPRRSVRKNTRRRSKSPTKRWERDKSSAATCSPERGSRLKAVKNQKAAVKIKKCTPEGKKRRKSRLMEPVVLDSFK